MAVDLDRLTICSEDEFAGYVDSGLWIMEEWLADQAASQNLRKMYFRDLWKDYFSS